MSFFFSGRQAKFGGPRNYQAEAVHRQQAEAAAHHVAVPLLDSGVAQICARFGSGFNLDRLHGLPRLTCMVEEAAIANAWLPPAQPTAAVKWRPSKAASSFLVHLVQPAPPNWHQMLHSAQQIQAASEIDVCMYQWHLQQARPTSQVYCLPVPRTSHPKESTTLEYADMAESLVDDCVEVVSATQADDGLDQALEHLGAVLTVNCKTVSSILADAAASGLIPDPDSTLALMPPPISNLLPMDPQARTLPATGSNAAALLAYHASDIDCTDSNARCTQITDSLRESLAAPPAWDLRTALSKVNQLVQGSVQQAAHPSDAQARPSSPSTAATAAVTAAAAPASQHHTDLLVAWFQSNQSSLTAAQLTDRLLHHPRPLFPSPAKLCGGGAPCSAAPVPRTGDQLLTSSVRQLLARSVGVPEDQAITSAYLSATFAAALQTSTTAAARQCSQHMVRMSADGLIQQELNISTDGCPTLPVPWTRPVQGTGTHHSPAQVHNNLSSVDLNQLGYTSSSWRPVDLYLDWSLVAGLDAEGRTNDSCTESKVGLGSSSDALTRILRNPLLQAWMPPGVGAGTGVGSGAAGRAGGGMVVSASTAAWVQSLACSEVQLMHQLMQPPCAGRSLSAAATSGGQAAAGAALSQQMVTGGPDGTRDNTTGGAAPQTGPIGTALQEHARAPTAPSCSTASPHDRSAAVLHRRQGNVPAEPPHTASAPRRLDSPTRDASTASVSQLHGGAEVGEEQEEEGVVLTLWPADVHQDSPDQPRAGQAPQQLGPQADDWSQHLGSSADQARLRIAPSTPDAINADRKQINQADVPLALAVPLVPSASAQDRSASQAAPPPATASCTVSSAISPAASPVGAGAATASAITPATAAAPHPTVSATAAAPHPTGLPPRARSKVRPAPAPEPMDSQLNFLQQVSMARKRPRLEHVTTRDAPCAAQPIANDHTMQQGMANAANQSQVGTMPAVSGTAGAVRMQPVHQERLGHVTQDKLLHDTHMDQDPSLRKVRDSSLQPALPDMPHTAAHQHVEQQSGQQVSKVGADTANGNLLEEQTEAEPGVVADIQHVQISWSRLRVIKVQLGSCHIGLLLGLAQCRDRLMSKLRQVPIELKVDQALLSSHTLDVHTAEDAISQLQQSSQAAHSTHLTAAQQQALIQVYTSIMVLSQTCRLLSQQGITTAYLYLHHMMTTMTKIAPLCGSALPDLASAYQRVKQPAAPDHLMVADDASDHGDAGGAAAGAAAALPDQQQHQQQVVDHPLMPRLTQLLEAQEQEHPGSNVLIVGDRRCFPQVYQAAIAAGMQPHHFDRQGAWLQAPTNPALPVTGATASASGRLQQLEQQLRTTLDSCSCLLVDYGYIEAVMCGQTQQLDQADTGQAWVADANRSIPSAPRAPTNCQQSGILLAPPASGSFLPSFLSHLFSHIILLPGLAGEVQQLSAQSTSAWAGVTSANCHVSCLEVELPEELDAMCGGSPASVTHTPAAAAAATYAPAPPAPGAPSSSSAAAMAVGQTAAAVPDPLPGSVDQLGHVEYDGVRAVAVSEPEQEEDAPAPVQASPALPPPPPPPAAPQTSAAVEVTAAWQRPQQGRQPAGCTSVEATHPAQTDGTYISTALPVPPAVHTARQPAAGVQRDCEITAKGASRPAVDNVLHQRTSTGLVQPEVSKQGHEAEARHAHAGAQLDGDTTQQQHLSSSVGGSHRLTRQIVISCSPSSLIVKRPDLYQALLMLEKHGVQGPVQGGPQPPSCQLTDPSSNTNLSGINAAAGAAGGGCAATQRNHVVQGVQGIDVELVERVLPLVDVCITPNTCLCVWPVQAPSQQEVCVDEVVQEVMQRLVMISKAYSQAYIIIEATDSLSNALLLQAPQLHTHARAAGLQIQLLTSGSELMSQTLVTSLCTHVASAFYFPPQSSNSSSNVLTAEASIAPAPSPAHPLQEQPSACELFLCAFSMLNPLSISVLQALGMSVGQLLAVASQGRLVQAADDAVIAGLLPGYVLCSSRPAASQLAPTGLKDSHRDMTGPGMRGLPLTSLTSGVAQQHVQVPALPLELAPGWLGRCIPVHSLELWCCQLMAINVEVPEDEYEAEQEQLAGAGARAGAGVWQQEEHARDAPGDCDHVMQHLQLQQQCVQSGVVGQQGGGGGGGAGQPWTAWEDEADDYGEQQQWMPQQQQQQAAYHGHGSAWQQQQVAGIDALARGNTARIRPVPPSSSWKGASQHSSRPPVMSWPMKGSQARPQHQPGGMLSSATGWGGHTTQGEGDDGGGGRADSRHPGLLHARTAQACAPNWQGFTDTPSPGAGVLRHQAGGDGRKLAVLHQAGDDPLVLSDYQVSLSDVEEESGLEMGWDAGGTRAGSSRGTQLQQEWLPSRAAQPRAAQPRAGHALDDQLLADAGLGYDSDELGGFEWQLPMPGAGPVPGGRTSYQGMSAGAGRVVGAAGRVGLAADVTQPTLAAARQASGRQQAGLPAPRLWQQRSTLDDEDDEQDGGFILSANQGRLAPTALRSGWSGYPAAAHSAHQPVQQPNGGQDLDGADWLGGDGGAAEQGAGGQGIHMATSSVSWAGESMVPIAPRREPPLANLQALRQFAFTGGPGAKSSAGGSLRQMVLTKAGTKPAAQAVKGFGGYKKGKWRKK